MLGKLVDIGKTHVDLSVGLSGSSYSKQVCIFLSNIQCDKVLVANTALQSLYLRLS